MIKLVSVEAEGAHQSIRRARQKGMDAIKKAFKAASADDKKRTEKEVRQHNTLCFWCNETVRYCGSIAGALLQRRHGVCPSGMYCGIVTVGTSMRVSCATSTFIMTCQLTFPSYILENGVE
jgi:hypothetical protein